MARRLGRGSDRHRRAEVEQLVRVAAPALPILLTTAYITYSRGAALALAAGLIAVVAFDRRRLTLLTSGVLVALPAAAAVWLAGPCPT